MLGKPAILIDPEAYLREVRTRIAEHPIIALKNCCRGMSLPRLP
jgi:hypothetical protein